MHSQITVFAVARGGPYQYIGGIPAGGHLCPCALPFLCGPVLWDAHPYCVEDRGCNLRSRCLCPCHGIPGGSHLSCHNERGKPGIRDDDHGVKDGEVDKMGHCGRVHHCGNILYYHRLRADGWDWIRGYPMPLWTLIAWIVQLRAQAPHSIHRVLWTSSAISAKTS
jgi:hypothetical protein